MPSRWNRKLVRFVLLGSPLILAACASGSMPAKVFGPASEMEPVIPTQTGFEAPVVEKIDPAELLRLAHELRAKGDVAGAAHFYAQAHDANPDDVSALIGLGDMLAALGDAVRAADAYGKATALQPAGLEARIGLAKASIAMDNPQVATTQFQAVLKSNAKDVRAYNGLGVAADMMGDHKAAQEYYRTGLAIDPQNIALLNNLGLSLALSGDFDNGIFMLEELAASPDASPTTRQNLALAYGLAGRDEEAERVARVDLGEAEIRKNMAFIASQRANRDSKAITKALNVEMAKVAAAGMPTVVRPEQAAEVQRAAIAAAAEASPAAADADDDWYYEEPVVAAAPTTAVESEPLDAPAPQLAATDPATARAMRGLPAPAGMAAMAVAAVPFHGAEPADAEPLTVVDTSVTKVAPAETLEIVEAPDSARALEILDATDTAAAVDVIDMAELVAPAAESEPVVAAEAAVTSDPVVVVDDTVLDTLDAEPVVTTQVARSAPAGAVPRAILALPVTAVMSNALSATGPTPVTFYDALPETQYCKDAGVAVVNCLVSSAGARGRVNSALAMSASFDFSMN